MTEKRKAALYWWREVLGQEGREVFARIYFPDLPFDAVDASSSKIQKCYEINNYLENGECTNDEDNWPNQPSF